MKQLICLVIPFFFISCTPALRYVEGSESIVHEKTANEKAGKDNSIRNFETLEALESSVETASYYADKFNGRKTANGEIYNMHDLTAAHISYPFNTICRVTNLKNQKSVIVRINDRKPDTNDRSIDLSLGAAKEIDMVKGGLTEVRVDILEWGAE